MLTLSALVFRKFMNLVISFYIQPRWKKSITNESTSEKSLDVNRNNLKKNSSEAINKKAYLNYF